MDKLTYFVYILRTKESLAVPYFKIQHLSAPLLIQLSQNPATKDLLRDICAHIFDIVLVGSSYPPITALPLGMPHVLHASGVREFGTAGILINSTPAAIQTESFNFPIEEASENDSQSIIGTTSVRKDVTIPMLASLESLKLKILTDAQTQDTPVFPPIIKGYERALMAMNAEYLPDNRSTDTPCDYSLPGGLGNRGLTALIDAPLQQLVGDHQYVPVSAAASRLFRRMDLFWATNYLCYDHISVGDAAIYHYMSEAQGRESTIASVLVLVRRIWAIDGRIFPSVFLDGELLVRSEQLTTSLSVFLTGILLTLPISDPTVCKGVQRVPLTFVINAHLQDDKVANLHIPLQGGLEDLLYPEVCCTETCIRTCHVVGRVSLAEIPQSAHLFQCSLTCSLIPNQNISLRDHSVTFQDVKLQDLEEEQDESKEEAVIDGQLYSSKSTISSTSSSVADAHTDGNLEPQLKRRSFHEASGLYLQALDLEQPSISCECSYHVTFSMANMIRPVLCSICQQELGASDLFIGELSDVYTLDAQRFLGDKASDHNMPIFPTIEIALLLNAKGKMYLCPQCFSPYCKACKMEMLNSPYDQILYQTNLWISSAHQKQAGFENLNTPCWKCDLSTYASAGISADFGNPMVQFYLHKLIDFMNYKASEVFLDSKRLASSYSDYFKKVLTDLSVPTDQDHTIQLAARQFLHELDALRSSWHFASNLIEWRYSPQCTDSTKDSDIIESNLKKQTRSFTSLLDLVSTIRYSYPDEQCPSVSEKCVLISMDLHFSVPSPLDYRSFFANLPTAGLYENSNRLLLPIFPRIWSSSNRGANLLFYGAPFYSRVYLEYYQGKDLEDIKNPLQDTPQTSLSKRKPRGKPAGSTTLAAASSGIQNTSGTSRRRGLASLGGSLSQDTSIKLEESPNTTQREETNRKPQARRAKASTRGSRQVADSNALFQSDVNGIPLVSQGKGGAHQVSSTNSNSLSGSVGPAPGSLQILPGGGLSAFGSGAVHRHAAHTTFPDTVSAVFPTSYIDNYLMPNLTHEALSSWIGQSIRPFCIPEHAKVMYTNGIAASGISSSGDILTGAESGVVHQKAEKDIDSAKLTSQESANVYESSIVHRQSNLPFSLPSSMHITRLKNEINENCLFYTGFDRALRFLIEEYSESNSNAWMDSDLKNLLEASSRSEIPISRNMPILQKLKAMLSSRTDETPDAATILKHLMNDILPEFLETRYQLETHYDYGHTSESIRILQTLNSLVNVSSFASISSCEDGRLFSEIKQERDEQARDERDEAKEVLSLIDKERAKKLTTQQTMLAVDELTSSPPRYNLKPPPEYATLPPKSDYLMIDDEIAALSGKSVTKKTAQQSEILDSLVQKISCLDFLLRSAQQRDNMPTETASSRPSASIISMEENANQTFPRSATMRHLILEKREAELRSYLETLGTAEARTRKSMEELLTSIDAVRRGMIELRRKQAMLVDELIDFVKEKYRLDHTIAEVVGVVGDIAVALSTIRIPVTDRQLPSDVQCLKQLKQYLFEHLCKLL